MALVGECYIESCKFFIEEGMEYAKITNELRKLLWD